MANLVRPNVVVVVFVQHKGKYLAGKRITGRGKDQWAVVGGHLEFGETFEEACKRETMEETGLEITDVTQVMAKNYRYIDNYPQEDGRYAAMMCEESKYKHHVVCIFFHAVLKEEKELINKEPDKHDEWGWFSLEDWPMPTLEPIDELYPLLEGKFF